jgi:hypothetical protein
MSRHCSIFDLSRPLTDQQLRRNELAAAITRPSPRYPKCSAGAKAGDELAAECSASLDVESLIDCFMGDTHRFVVWKFDG